MPIDLIRSLPCAVCSHSPPSDPHHIKTRGAGGDDSLENLLSLCRPHHVEIHTIGRKTFLNKYKDNIAKSRALNKLPEVNI